MIDDDSYAHEMRTQSNTVNTRKVKTLQEMITRD